jgi:hypothetical protein
MIKVGSHPERKDDEVYLTNSSDEAFGEMCWQTGRKGNICHDAQGEPFSSKSLFPIFVKKSELEAAGFVLQG